MIDSRELTHSCLGLAENALRFPADFWERLEYPIVYTTNRGARVTIRLPEAHTSPNEPALCFKMEPPEAGPDIPAVEVTVRMTANPPVEDSVDPVHVDLPAEVEREMDRFHPFMNVGTSDLRDVLQEGLTSDSTRIREFCAQLLALRK